MKRKKITLQHLMIRGSIGKQFVIKHYGKKVVRTKFPDMTGIIATAKQKDCRNLFKEAVAWAKEVIADPVRKKEWQRRLRRRNGVYNAAVKEYMQAAKRMLANPQPSLVVVYKDPAYNQVFRSAFETPFHHGYTNNIYSILNKTQCQIIKNIKERRTGSG